MRSSSQTENLGREGKYCPKFCCVPGTEQEGMREERVSNRYVPPFTLSPYLFDKERKKVESNWAHIHTQVTIGRYLFALTCLFVVCPFYDYLLSVVRWGREGDGCKPFLPSLCSSSLSHLHLPLTLTLLRLMRPEFIFSEVCSWASNEKERTS